MTVYGDIHISNDPTLVQRTISSNNPFTNEGIFSIESATFQVNSTFSSIGTSKGCNDGVLDLTNATVTTMGKVAPGCSPGILTIAGDYENSGGDLDIEIGGTTVETEYDRLKITGNATLSGGNINLSLANGYTPETGHSFTILDASTLSGTFSIPTNTFIFEGYNWEIVYNDVQGTIKLNVQSAALPLELLYFQAFAEGEKNRLAWRSASETNFFHYEIERSPDAKNWSKLGTVAGAGNATEERSYQFTDHQPLPLGYYRLHMKDLDGSGEFSKVVSVERQGQEGRVRISPNPFSDELEINFDLQEAGRASFSLTDVAGRVVWQSAAELEEGENRLHFELSSLPQGVYQLLIQLPAGRISEQVVKM